MKNKTMKASTLPFIFLPVVTGTPEEMAKSINDSIDSLKQKIEGAAKSEDVEYLKQELETLKNSGVKEETVKSLEDKLEEVGLKIVELETKGGQANEEGSIVKMFKENVKKHNLTEKNPKPAASYSLTETIKAPALMTTANVVPNVAGGFSPLFGNYIDNEIGHIPKPDPVFMQLVTVKYQPGTENIYYTDRINEEGTAQFIAEGGTKPLIDAEWKTTSQKMKEVAERWKFTTRLMYHAPAAVADFREHANELIEKELDDAILEGDNTGNNLNGLVANAGAFVVPTQLANYYADANIYDVISAMATQIRLANFKGQITAVLNTVWQAIMMGTKNTQGDYLVVPFRSPDGKTIGDVNVVFTNKMPDTDILIGDLKKYNLVISEDAIYTEGYSGTDFDNNLVSRKIETFAEGYVKLSNDGAILYDTIADVLTDIEIVPAP